MDIRERLKGSDRIWWGGGEKEAGRGWGTLNELTHFSGGGRGRGQFRRNHGINK